MIPLSSRWLGPLIALALLAAVPMLTLGGRRADDCATPGALLDDAFLYGARPHREFREHYADWVFQWSEGSVPALGKGVPPLRYRVLRSYRPWALYRNPTHFLGIAIDADRSQPDAVELAGRPAPVELVYGRANQWVRVVGYGFVFDGEPVRSLLPAQLGSALTQLRQGTRPLTLFLVSGFAPEGKLEAIEGPARSWLAAAFAHYRRVCSTAGNTFR